MEPVQLGPLKLQPFGLIFIALLIPFFVLCALQMKKNGLKKETASWFALLAVPLCFLLSRLGFCFLIIDHIIGADDFGMVFRTWEGGFLLWGAIGGLLLAAKLSGKITRQSGAVIADSAVIPACLMIVAIRLLCGLLFEDMGIGFRLDNWFDPEETDFAFRVSLWPLEDWSFFERFPFAVENYYGDWCWAVFVLQALWAGITALLVSRPKAAPGGKAARFIILFSCGSIVLESMLHSGEIVHLPWLGFVKANQILCAAALLAVAVVCLRRLEKGSRLRPAVILFAQFLAAIGVIIVLEFTTFEKKIEMIEWLPADACRNAGGFHLLHKGAGAAMSSVIEQMYRNHRLSASLLLNRTGISRTPRPGRLLSGFHHTIFSGREHPGSRRKKSGRGD